MLARQQARRAVLEEELRAVRQQAQSDAARWREEVSLKQAHVDMLVAGDRGREAEFMAQRVQELQVCAPCEFLFEWGRLFRPALCWSGQFCS